MLILFITNERFFSFTISMYIFLIFILFNFSSLALALSLYLFILSTIFQSTTTPPLFCLIFIISLEGMEIKGDGRGVGRRGKGRRETRVSREKTFSLIFVARKEEDKMNWMNGWDFCRQEKRKRKAELQERKKKEKEVGWEGWAMWRRGKSRRKEELK